MKQLTTLLLAIMLSLIASSQSTTFTMTFGGFVSIGSEVQTIIYVQNIQSCPLEVTVTGISASTVKTVTRSIPAHTEDSVHLSLPPSKIVQLQGNGKSNCGGIVTTSYLSLTVDMTAMPIKFAGPPKVKRLGNREFLVTFEVLEAEGVNKYEIMLSEDGKNWKTRAIVFPLDTKPGTYSVKVKI